MRVIASDTIEAPPAALFECVADYAVAPLFIEGLQRLTPVGPTTTGEGARFDAVMKVWGLDHDTTVEITEYEEEPVHHLGVVERALQASRPSTSNR